MVFDRKGQENFNNHALRNPASEETDKLGTLGENVDLAWDVAKYQHTGLAESLNYRDKIKDQFKLLYDITGDEQYNTRFLSHQIVGAKKKAGETQLKDFDLNKRFYEEQNDTITKLQLQYPDSGLVTWNQMSEKRNAELKQMNVDLQKLQDRSQTEDVFLGNVASMGAYFMDPELLATLPFSGGASVGGRIAQNAWRGFKIESALAFVSETAIAPKIYEFQHQIGNEQYGLKDAAIRIMTSTVAAGVIRAGGSVTIDLSKIAIAKAKLIKRGQIQEAHVLDFYVKSMEDANVVADATGKTATNPEAVHVAAQTKVAQAFEKGETVAQKDLDDVLGGAEPQKVDPREIQVDAETFQYKSGGDELGVTDALKGVTKWEAIKADSILVWERADGTRFVADGHQRLALAKRLIGEDAQEVGLSAFILREKDGFSPAFVREYAALRNIADNKGTAIDAAKVLRGTGKGLDDLPPNSPLVRDAKGLSKLDDVAFKMVIDDVISHKYGAIVGDLIEDAAAQAATIRALKQLKPANSFQARLMVEDMKAAGFSTTKTDDLFGGIEITESLFKERAKVIDSTIKKLKKDKQVFRTLAEQETKISEAGNILDTQANIARLTDDEKTLATLSALANTKGPISDAINAAARRVKDGESVAQATKDLLPEVKRAVERGFAPETEPKVGRPIRLTELDEVTRNQVVKDFKLKQKKQNLTAEQYHKKAQAPQKQIEKIGREIEKTLGENVTLLTPGVKLLEKVKNKIINKKYDGAWQLTDVCRCGFAVKDTKDIDKIIARLSKDVVVLDEGINFRESGYFDHVLSVRFKNGIIGEIQLLEPHLLAVKEGSEFVEQVFPKHLKEYVSDIKVPSKKKSGHDLYEQQKELLENGKVKEGKQEAFNDLDNQMEFLYARAEKSANTSWKASLERDLPESLISTGETRSQLELGSDKYQPSSRPSDGSIITAGRPSQLKKRDTSFKSNIDKSSTKIITQEKEAVKGFETSDLAFVADQHLTSSSFVDSLHNRSFEYSTGKKSEEAIDDLFNPEGFVIGDKKNYVKHILSNNFLEEQRNLFKDNPVEFREAMDELGVIYSKEEGSWVLPPKDIEAYYKGTEKLTKVSEADLKEGWLQHNTRSVEDSTTQVLKPGVEQPVIKTGEMADLDDIRINEAQQLLDEVGDIEVVSGIKDSGKGEFELEFKTARAAFEEIDNEQKIVDDLFKCVGGTGG